MRQTALRAAVRTAVPPKITVAERYDRVRLDSLKAAVARLDNEQPSRVFKSGRSARSCKISKFHFLNDMPGWRNWQTHRT